MAYRGNPANIGIPELESVTRLRESIEGGPGSGPQSGQGSQKVSLNPKVSKNLDAYYNQIVKSNKEFGDDQSLSLSRSHPDVQEELSAHLAQTSGVGLDAAQKMVSAWAKQEPKSSGRK